MCVHKTAGSFSIFFPQMCPLAFTPLNCGQATSHLGALRETPNRARSTPRLYMHAERRCNSAVACSLVHIAYAQSIFADKASLQAAVIAYNAGATSPLCGGPISSWGVSAVTNMNRLFIA